MIRRWQLWRMRRRIRRRIDAYARTHADEGYRWHS